MKKYGQGLGSHMATPPVFTEHALTLALYISFTVQSQTRWQLPFRPFFRLKILQQ